jgi:hypothetical protein
MRTSHIHLPGRADKINTLYRQTVGKGIGTVLLDGGMGGQSSYQSLDDYYSTTNRGKNSGRGLSDKIGDRLSKLKINSSNKPRMKNIVI